MEVLTAEECSLGVRPNQLTKVAGVAVVADFATGGRNHGGGGQQTDAGLGEQFRQAGLCLASTAPR